jgi:hypothetical protein
MARDHEAAWRACAPEATINRLNCDPDQMLKEPTVKSLAGCCDYAKASSTDARRRASFSRDLISGHQTRRSAIEL